MRKSSRPSSLGEPREKKGDDLKSPPHRLTERIRVGTEGSLPPRSRVWIKTGVSGVRRRVRTCRSRPPDEAGRPATQEGPSKSRHESRVKVPSSRDPRTPFDSGPKMSLSGLLPSTVSRSKIRESHICPLYTRTIGLYLRLVWPSHYFVDFGVACIRCGIHTSVGRI